jgi:branched-chain amino acid transport system permease protein
MQRPADRMRQSARALLVLATLLLGGCAGLVDSDQQRLCRSLLPALEAEFDRFEIVRVDDLTATPANGVILRLAYRASAAVGARNGRGEAQRRVHTVICSFKPAPAGAAPVLVAVTGDRGPLAPARLYMLQRYWIDSGLAARSDPMPVAMLGGAPSLPRPVAIGLQQALGGLPLTAVYALLATAYALIYGLVGRINLAFGDLASLAGYGAFLGFSMIGEGHGGLAVLLALGCALFTAATHGGALGRLVIARLAHAPGQHILIATIGVSIFWQEAMRLTQGAGNRWLPPLMNRPIGVARAGAFTVTVTPKALVVAFAAAAAAGALVVAMRRSSFGLRWRACADDPVAAAMLGIAPRAILLQTMVLAALLSGLGGALTTLYYGGIGYAGGLVVGLKALMAAIIGGIGSVHGALAGALLVGVAETVWSGVFPIEYRDPALFTGLVLVLWLKPAGFFGTTDPPAGGRRDA